jgi:hypothetical protein
VDELESPFENLSKNALFAEGSADYVPDERLGPFAVSVNVAIGEVILIAEVFLVGS